jgi:flavin-dependent dehydrogenase
MIKDDAVLSCDVAIVGGGPAGSTVATLLKKYAPSLEVSIFEREFFPRDHVGESQLPGVSAVLHEMGAWDKVERANFPVKLGATLLWGRSKELWDFDFVPPSVYKEHRPGSYDGPRRQTAFHVDRSIYDKILLDHARECGVHVYEGSEVERIEAADETIQALRLEGGATVRARHYVDASGNPAILRRALGVKTTTPTSLMNVAFWDYWQGADWAVKVGETGTRIQVMSVDYGWLWFIPIGAGRTSIGLVVPVYYYKQMGMRPEDLYGKAIADCPRINMLLSAAKSEGKFSATKDWSFVADRATGPNWYLVGESAGFADPILSAGLTIAQSAARELAYTINEIDKGEISPEWLKSEFGRRQLTRVRSHIRFADFWYSSNAQLKDLKEYTSHIAKDSGLALDPESAWRWIALGGFVDTDLAAGTGSFSLEFIRSMGEFLQELKFESPLRTCNIFDLDIEGAEETETARYEAGRVRKSRCLCRNGRVFPIEGVFGLVHDNLKENRSLLAIITRLEKDVEPMRRTNPRLRSLVLLHALRALEALTYDGWVRASLDRSAPKPDLQSTYSSLHWNCEGT